MQGDVERSNIVLREGTPGDAREIAEIWYLGWRVGHLGFVPRELVDARTEDSFSERASERFGEMTVAVIDGATAGFVLVVDNEVEQVYLAANYRGMGIADALMREAERQVRANGHARGWLAVVAGNARARAFYERMGWRNEGPFVYEAVAGEGTIGVPSLRYAKDV
jgi:GNAT superfamily N-acetyltransferase